MSKHRSSRFPLSVRGRLPPGIFSILAAVLLSVPLAPMSASGQGTSKINWAEHHDHEEVSSLVNAWAEKYPELVDVESVGESLQGRELWLLTITNTRTGAADEKPALWVDANSDAPQVLTKEVALYFSFHLLSQYESNERIRRLLDRRAVYVMPNANPDPGEQLIQPPKEGVIQGVSRDGYLVPWDEDGDGLKDEDPPEDINGDGLITSMRVRDQNGQWKADPEFPSLMVRRQPGDGPEDGPYYRRYATEGIDNDDDGRLNEDWLGDGFDSNRIFPGNWQPAHRQNAAPPYPLYTPSAKALVDAILARPNIAAVVSLHTSGQYPGGTLYAPPASEAQDGFPSFDMSYLYPEVGRHFERIMRGDENYPHSCATAVNTLESLGEPIYGSLIDWAYINRGIIAWTPEVWTGAYDYDGDCRISQEERWRWTQEEWDGRPFLEWRQADHPRFGSVEVGGWRNDFAGNGVIPPEGWEDRSRQMTRFLVHTIGLLPETVLENLRSERVAAGLYRVEATVRNRGFLPTTSTAYGATLNREGGFETGVRSVVPYARPVRASLEVESGAVVSDREIEIGHLRGTNGGDGRGAISENWSNRSTVSWIVSAPEGTGVTVRAGTPRSGVATDSLTVE